MKIQKRYSDHLMVRNRDTAIYATGKLAVVLTVGIVSMFIFFGIAAVKSVGQVNNNLLN